MFICLFIITSVLEYTLLNSDSDNKIRHHHHHHHHHLHVVAKSTYSKVLRCLLSSWMLHDKNESDYRFPEDAEAHYLQLLEKTAPYRSMPVHSYANYDGPWVENWFILKYSKKPLSYFRGFVPIFVQWIDTQILRGRHFDNLLATLSGVLRPNVVYIAVSQGDVGLGKIGMAHPNILVLAAGGFGHVIIPLIRSEIPWTDLPVKFEQDIGFFGTAQQQQSSRKSMLDLVEKFAEQLNMSYKVSQGPTWQHDMEMTKFNLAPRGYGRSSFRFAESIQMGRIPVFLYDDHPWIPYLGTDCSVETFGFRAGLYDKNNTIETLVHQMKNLTEDEFNSKLQKLYEIRSMFTYEGLFHEFELFINDPFGLEGGHLVCTTHPHTERCCG